MTEIIGMAATLAVLKSDDRDIGEIDVDDMEGNVYRLWQDEGLNVVYLTRDQLVQLSAAISRILG